jgi:Mannosylglycerate hydrolase MGH1-like glycoside hydrolase domain
VKRREFLAKSGVLASGFPFLSRSPVLRETAFRGNLPEEQPGSRIWFETSDAPYQAIYSRALQVLERNTRLVSGYPGPVLTEGSNYNGIWLECAPHEGLIYSVVRPDIARNNHLAFFALQRADGQLPCWSRTTAAGFGQTQMVVPIAATAWELSQLTGDSQLLETAYAGCSRWDAWLRRYRDTRRSGLCEGFCTWDTGRDNSPRWAGIPNQCPDADARKCPAVPSLPKLCPDLSASVYGGRVALAAMARALGKNSEGDRWLADANAIRSAIIDKLYSAADAAFYDLDAQGHFVRVRGDLISRVLAEHVVDRQIFEAVYERQIHNPAAFWAPYPLPSIALDDPAFVRPIPRNSWGGATQALTALRAPRWMEYYGKPADLAHLMRQWVSAILRQDAFLQQMDPLTGIFAADAGDYSPAALVFVDFTWRFAGVRLVSDHLEWNVNPPASDVRASYGLHLSATRAATINYNSGRAELLLDGRLLCSTSSTVRLISSLHGQIQSAVGNAPKKANVVLRHASGGEQVFSIEPNNRANLNAR